MPRKKKIVKTRTGPDRGVTYCRVSTKEQAEKYSLVVQRKECDVYAGRQGWEVAEKFVDRGESAKSADRPEFQRMLEYCERNAGAIQFVLVSRIDRFARNSADHLTVRARLKALGIALHSATERLEDTPEGRFVETVHAAAAQLDNDLRAVRCTSGMREAVTEGRWPFYAPLGYINGNSTGPTLESDRARAAFVVRAFELVAGGVSRKEALRRLSADGFRTRRGRKLSAEDFGRLLRNEIYAGWLVVPEWGLRVRGQLQPLVSEELFLRVQKNLRRRAELGGRRPHQAYAPDFPLRRFVRCGRCARPLTGS